MKRWQKDKVQQETGQGFVEFALILPILLMIVFGIIELGRLLFVFVAVHTSSREAARFGSSVGDTSAGVPRYADCDAIRDEATTLGSLVGIADADITISYDDGPGGTAYGSCPVGGTGPTSIDLGDRIIVLIQANYSPLVPIVPIPAFPINSTTRRTILDTIPVGTAVALATSGTTATSTSSAPIMWVESIELVATNPNGNKWEPQATVTMMSANGVVDVATVTGSFSGDTTSTDSGTTNSFGEVLLIGDEVNGSWSTWTFCVTAAVHASYSYDPGSNVETCETISSGGTATPTPTTASQQMWVSAMTYTLVNPNGNKWQMEVVVTIYDIFGPVSGATVTGEFTGDWAGDTDSGTTDAAGQVTLQSSSINHASTGEFCVTDVDEAAHYYEVSLNNPSPPCVSTTGTSTPTRTATPTATNTGTSTPTATHTPGPSPTASSTPSPTASPTTTGTATITPAPTPVCNYTVGSIIVNDDDFFWDITNNTGATVTIASIISYWPDDPSSQKMTALYFGGTEIWSGSWNSPPTGINSGWSGTIADRQISTGTLKTFQFAFFRSLEAGTISAQVTFDDGCVLSASIAYSP